MYSPEELKEMREWVLDCSVNYDDQQDREDATDEEIIRYVKMNYDGGMAAFLAVMRHRMQ